MENNPRYRSLFWPILLVGVGIVWLLSNLGVIEQVSIGSLLRLWPIILIVLGLDILFSRRYPWVGAVVGLLAVAGVVGFLLVGPKLGLDAGPVTKTETFSTPLEGVEAVEYVFDTSSYPVSIEALEGNSSDLIIAEIRHRSTMRFNVSGTTNKKVTLSEESSYNNWFYWDFSTDNFKWNIGLAPDVPSDIILDGGSGSIQMDLSGIELSSFRADLGSGSSSITLPETVTPYSMEINGGSGSVRIDLPEDSSLTLVLDSASGSTTVNVPSGAAYRIEVEDDGSGSLSFSRDLEKSSDSNSFDVGAWETADYEEAEHQILIKIVDQGSGSVTIR